MSKDFTTIRHIIFFAVTKVTLFLFYRKKECDNQRGNISACFFRKNNLKKQEIHLFIKTQKMNYLIFL